MWWKRSPERRRYRFRLSSKNIGRLLRDAQGVEVI
jgi:hypothetical protein